VGDINDVKFLPSKQVCMSASSDCMIKVWRIEDALCALTLKGHGGGVLSFDLIDRGKQFISSSRDGSIRLWDCSQGKSISCIVEKTTSMNQCSLEKVIAVGVSEDGGCYLIDWENKKVIFQFIHNNPLRSCHLDNGIVSLGSSTGELITFDTRKPEDHLIRKRISPSAILAIQPNSWTSQQDGSVLHWTDSSIDMDLTGSNFDPVYDFHVGHDAIYTICRDQRLRKYLI